uniref:Secreted protein n=1 Tax=Heterorhabditis bacteriophora TaxID=37862 RepID=A0A1I7WBH0_HETBA
MVLVSAGDLLLSLLSSRIGALVVEWWRLPAAGDDAWDRIRCSASYFHIRLVVKRQLMGGFLRRQRPILPSPELLGPSPLLSTVEAISRETYKCALIGLILWRFEHQRIGVAC